MGTIDFLALLTLGTLLAVTIFALVSKKKVEDRLHGKDGAPKSTLAVDKASKGTPADV